MLSRALVLAGALVVTGAAVSTGVAAPASPAAASSCKGKAPTDLRLTRSRSGLRGRLHWRAPRVRVAGSNYRVYRDGAVVGQTSRRSMRVRTTLRKQHRFSVRMVSPSGHVSRCRAVLERMMTLRAPGRPHGLAIKRVRDVQVTVTWLRAHRGAARLAGYRIYRDGKTMRQVRGLTARVMMPGTGRYKLKVAAVDTNGMVGPSTDSVVVRARHRAPIAPRALRITGVTDTDVGLAWPASRARKKRIVGYRVFRNGVPLWQVKALTTQVSNLAPATGYRFTVAAVDSIGYMSPESPAAAVTTAMPPPTAGYLHAFMLASTDQSFVDMQAHYRQIGYLYPTYFDCRADASLVGNDDPLVTRWAQLRRIAVMPRVNCQNEQTLTQILTDPATRSRWVDAITGLVDRYGYDGINLDFEKGNAGIRSALTSFVATLADRLHARGKKVTIEVSAKRFSSQEGRPAFYDYPRLGAAADFVFVMNWGLHWAVSGPGPLDDLPWATAVADYVATMPTKSKFVLGTNLYGYDWPNGGGPNNRATALEYGDMVQLIARVRARPRWDSSSASWTFSYTEPNGTPHEVWYTDNTSFGVRLHLARKRGLGLGVWRLGTEDQHIWEQAFLAPGVVWP
jgi:spore germination protein YaaH